MDVELVIAYNNKRPALILFMANRGVEVRPNDISAAISHLHRLAANRGSKTVFFRHIFTAITSKKFVKVTDRDDPASGSNRNIVRTAINCQRSHLHPGLSALEHSKRTTR